MNQASMDIEEGKLIPYTVQTFSLHTILIACIYNQILYKM